MDIKKIIKEELDSLTNKSESNLNENFYKWFGNSKVIDSGGNPMVCYHATNVDFKVFSFKNSLQKIIWFTNDIDTIKNKNIDAAGYNITKELYIQMQNPAGWPEYKKYGLGQINENGFDGCLLKNNDGTFTGFVFKPNQIKSVNNDGTWDVNDNNIYS